MSVDQVAGCLGSTPPAVYGAYRILVPARAGQTRGKRPTVLEQLLTTSKEQLKTLERMGRSHEEIGVVLNTSQSIVSACLSVLAQREDALFRLSRSGCADPLGRLQDEEIRIRRESGAGLTVADVIDMAGFQIRRMNAEGIPLRQVAQELGLNREAVRKAYQQMTQKQVLRGLNQTQMEEAA